LTNTSSNLLPEKLMLALYYFYHGIALPVANESREELMRMVLDRTPATVSPSALPEPARAALESSAAAAPLSLEKYQGRYFNIAYRHFVVTVEGGKLFVTMGPDKIKAPLTRIKGNKFKVTFPDWPELESDLSFSVSGSGVKSLTAYFCLDVDNGVFVKK